MLGHNVRAVSEFYNYIIRTAKMLVKCPVLSRAPLPVRTRPCVWMVHVLVHDLVHLVLFLPNVALHSPYCVCF